MHYGGATQLLSIKCDGNSRISNNGQLFTAATFFWSMPAAVHTVTIIIWTLSKPRWQRHKPKG